MAEHERKRRRFRIPSVVPPLLLTVGMIALAVLVIDDGSEIASGERRSAVLTMLGDIGSGDVSELTMAAMAEAGADVHIALGDLSYAGPGSEPAWCELVRGRLGSTPVQLVAGNHEEDTGEDGRIANFERCLPDRMESEGLYAREYYFDIGKLARVILISPGLTIEGEHFYYGEDNVNQRWLEAVIDGARDAGIRWIVVGMHKTCISVGEYSCDVNQDLFSLLIEKDVDLVVSGHDHTYQRSVQLQAGSATCRAVLVDTYDPDCVADDGSDDGYRRGDGPVFVISGAGGDELYDIHEDDPERGYFTAVMGRNRTPRYGFLRVRLSEDKLEASFMPSTPGDFADRFVVVTPE
jgi:predicted phosphodiesterase